MTNFKQDYRKLFKKAMEEKNTDLANQLFESLCQEAGVPEVEDPNQKPDEEKVKKLAEQVADMLNNPGKGSIQGKKI